AQRQGQAETVEIQRDLIRVEGAEKHAGYQEQQGQDQGNQSHGKACGSGIAPVRASLADHRRSGVALQASGRGMALQTCSRSSLPGLKCGTCLPVSATDS